jgi:hypothetical protein
MSDPLLDRLTGLLRDADPVPPDVLAAAKASLDWLDIDTAVARLVADSLREAAAVRGTGARLLTFETDDVVIDIEVSEIGERLRIVGQVVPARAVTVCAEQPAATVEVRTDGLGRFTIDDLAIGRTRFVCVPEAGAPVRTEWTLL